MNKQKMVRAAGFVIGILVCISAFASITWGTAYNTGLRYQGFRALGGDENDFDSTYAELLQHNLHFTDATDYIRMAGSDDFIYMSSGNDQLHMGPGSDNIDFYGESGNTETIIFAEGENSVIKWTSASAQGGSGKNDLEIKTTGGDVIITLAN